MPYFKYLPKIPVYQNPRDFAFESSFALPNSPEHLLSLIDQHGSVQFSADNLADVGSDYGSGFHSLTLIGTIRVESSLRIVGLDPDPSAFFRTYAATSWLSDCQKRLESRDRTASPS